MVKRSVRKWIGPVMTSEMTANAEKKAIKPVGPADSRCS